MKKIIATLLVALSLSVGYGYLTEASATARVFPGTSSGKYIPIDTKGDKNGRAGYIPVDGTATVCDPGASAEDYIETLQGIALDAITLTGDDMKVFYFSNKDVTITDFPPEIVSMVFVDPADKDWNGDTIYLSAYDKDGCYWGQATFPKNRVEEGLVAIGYERTAK